MATLPLDYRAALIEDQRRIVLNTLLGEPEQTAMLSRVREALRALRHQVSADAARVLLDWLDEAGLVTVLGDAVPVARLTQRGEDVARGDAHVFGVARERR
ncbi:MAG: ArsR family transcriptional regulator [Lamprocystis purpurea]|jgi:Fe2+ or Zn2+ uptake regulation protein|uniref:VpaChn25_0724 family phage protein n=1 Tax=Lamprocystis purpurea TaxID=61598 RepID=UPI00037BA905|nr:hypothetical protein [Lamprocystis purpurea]MBV5274020.1 ArsR family transcriptional regulator [Lamprocystis purpurea]